MQNFSLHYCGDDDGGGRGACVKGISLTYL